MRFSEREQERRVVGRQQQRQLLGRGEQDVRRIAPLPLPPRHRRVAGAGLDLDRQPHLGDRRLQVARDIDRQRLQRRDVERVQPAAAPHAASGGDEAADGARGAQHRCARARSLFSPLPRAQRAWRGGVGGGGCFADSPAESSLRHPPPPTPSPPLRGGRGKRAARMSGADVRSEVTQFHQCRQKSRQRLAGAGGRDQQRGAVVAGFGQQLQLMLARRPAARGEPAAETVRQQFGRFSRKLDLDAGRHARELSRSRGFVEGGGDSPRHRSTWRGRSAASVRVRGLSHPVVDRLAQRKPLTPTPLPAKSGARETMLHHSVTGFSEICQSLPSKIEMCSVFIGV